MTSPEPAPARETTASQGTKASATGDGRTKGRNRSQDPTTGPPPRLFGTGVYLSGTARLSAGSRYSIQLSGSNLQVLGPNDRDPRHVGFTRSIVRASAEVNDDRLIIALGQGRNASVLVFIGIDGGRPGAVADAINDAVAAIGTPA